MKRKDGESKKCGRPITTKSQRVKNGRRDLELYRRTGFHCVWSLIFMRRHATQCSLTRSSRKKKGFMIEGKVLVALGDALYL